MPLLVCVLAGNPVTTAAVFDCLNTADARHLRRLHPTVASVVEAVPWNDVHTPVVDVVRWRTALPAAAGARLAWSAAHDVLTSEPAVAALSGITHLDMRKCACVTDELLLRLPTSLRTLSVDYCSKLTGDASFAHLTALTTLICSRTRVVSERGDGLPPSLQQLDVRHARVRASLAHLRLLRVLHVDRSELGAATLASLPPCLEELHAARCGVLTRDASFAHLTALRKLDVAHSAIGDGALATMPPSLEHLYARDCKSLTPAAALPPLPVLRLLDVSVTAIGNTLMASLPPSLAELQLACCSNVTAGATLDHVPALRVLHCIDAQLTPCVLAACRASGCAIPAARQLHGHTNIVSSLAALGDGRLASGDSKGEVRLWDVTAESKATAVMRARNRVLGLAALPDGCRLAIATYVWGERESYIEVWNADGGLPTRHATITICCHVLAMAVLADGRLAAGCRDGTVRVVDVDAGVVVTTLAGHMCSVSALAVLPNGALASASFDTMLRVWDVGAGACVGTLAVYASWETHLAVLADGRLAINASDGTVQLWDVSGRACVGVLTGHISGVTALAALPDGRLATGSGDGTIQVWDTRPTAAAGDNRAEVVGVLSYRVCKLLALPNGRLACIMGTTTVYLLEVPPPAAWEYR